ncbi:hypothetical protein C2845_PM13G11050 [Panicum miliaceum]|uniref:Uncharacterized protein n=1 Tax=Panicum miliaceum TaxID=4540 RepID=A0A3L6RP10_PANMI|nr:hypothetical protein C2845_PM13G11050 [Panicum miliaceum]
MGRDTPTYDTYPDPVYGFVDFVGELFAWGLAGGSAVHYIKGLRGSPSGARLAGAVNAVRQNAPRVAGKFGAYCVFLSAMESAVSFASGRDDTWSTAVAVATTCGLHGMRRAGAPAAARYTVLGATGYLGIAYALRVSEISRTKEEVNRGGPVPPVVCRRPDPGPRQPRWFRMMSPFITKEKVGKDTYYIEV